MFLSEFFNKNKPTDIAEAAESEVDATLAKIAAAGDDGYEMIYDGLNGLLGGEVQIILQDMYDDVSRENRLHPDDDYDQIIDHMMDHIESDWGQPGVAEGEKSPMAKDAQRADRIRSLKNLIAIAREQGRQLRVQELELELKKLQGVTEMDSQGYTGSRDRKKTSKYGSRDHYDLGGPESTGRPLTAKQMMDRAHKAMLKSMSNDEKVDKGWRNPNIDEGTEQVYNILALDKGNALKKPTKLKWKASSLEDIFDALAAQDWYPLEINGVEVIAGKRLKPGVAESAGNIGSAIKSLYRKIYAAGDDEIEYFYNASPIFAQYWDEYEGDLGSIIAEVDPEELAVIKAELESYVQDANLAEGDPGYNKHSFIGKIRRGREADNKGWGQLGQQFAANSEEEYRKALRKGNRYYNMTRGDNKTPGGFPKTTVESAEDNQVNEISDQGLQNYRRQAHYAIQGHKFGSMKDAPNAAAIIAKREKGMQQASDKIVARKKAEDDKRLAVLVAKLPELKAEYEQMQAKYKSLGGSNWQYADREQNLSDSEREARSMEGPMNNLWRQIQAAEKAQGTVEEDTTNSPLELSSMIFSTIEKTYPKLITKFGQATVSDAIMSSVEEAGSISSMDEVYSILQDVIHKLSKKNTGTTGLVKESRVYYNVIGTPAESLRKDFLLNQDNQGWYLNESASKHFHQVAEKAFGKPRKM